MIRKCRHPVVVGAVCCIAVLLLVTLIVTRSFLYGPLMFRRFVVQPIPGSVHRIEADHCQMSHLIGLYGSREHAYVLRFLITREDLSHLIAARKFKQWEAAQYSKGVLRFKTTDKYYMDIELYTEGRPQPGWFDLAKWDAWETYYVGEDNVGLSWLDANLLLYNERLGSACYIKYIIIGL